MLKLVSITALLSALAACQPDAQINNSAIATEQAVDERERSAPAIGANSFTEAQAQGHLASKGYTNPTPLVLNDKGEWAGQATLNGKTVDVIVDYQGNVVITE